MNLVLILCFVLFLFYVYMVTKVTNLSSSYINQLERTNISKNIKLNFCNDCKFSKKYPNNKLFCKNEFMLNNVYNLFKNKKSLKEDINSVLIFGDCDCSIIRLVAGKKCSEFVQKENIGFSITDVENK